MTVPTPGALAAEAQATAAALGAGAKLVDKVPGAAALGDLTDSVRAVRAWISNRHNWVRVGWFLSGAAMFTIGLVLIGERPIGKVAGAAGEAAKFIPK